MADEQIITNIVARSDFSNLIADVQKLTGSLSKLQQEVAGSNRALAGQIAATNAMFKETLQKTGQFSSHFVSLTSDVEKFGRNLDSGRLKLKDYFRVYQDHVRTHGGLVRDLAKQQVQLQNAVLQPLGKNAQGLMQYNVHIPRGLDLTKNKAAVLKQELQIMNKVIQDGGVQLINWGKNTQWAGRQLTVGLTLPLVAFGKAAADAFKVADQELTRLTKVYGDIAGSSAAELAKVRQDVSATAKELASAMGVNFAETISLAADIAATGKTGNELLSSVSETTRLAVLGEVDRQEAMKATLAIQSAFKQNTEELSQSINFLNAVENQTSTTLNDLVEAIPKAGPVIKGLGGSVKDLALYLTAMREGGINASEGANALKSALASLINPTDVAVKKFEGFGIDLLGIVNSNAGNVTETLFALQAALDRLNPLQKQQAIEQLFGKFQFSRLNALFENLGRQGSQTLQVLDLMKASTGELAAVANRELAAVTESASGKFKRAVESFKADMAGAGERFLNIGTKLITVLNKILDFAQKLPDPVKNILAFGGAFTAILGPIIMLTGVLANFFGYIIKGLGHFKALFKGAEGFKLLTPEILAAQHASSLLSDEFYNDALAADTLRLAIRKLSEDLAGLQANATNAKIAASGLGQVLTTTAGTPVGTMGGGRVVDPNNPLLGPRSRAAAHLNPRNPNDPSTIFGLTLQPIPVNRRIGANPQILMNDRLDDVEGLTTIGGVSTGVVASEHARYQALMATLGLQSRQEIEALKKTIKMGGDVSKEFIATFDDILPITQKLSSNAAAQSAAIVAELRAGKISVEQARAAIISVNAQLEREMGIAVTQYGAGVGRTIDLTKAPLIDQPIVDPSGKPNTRGMYRKGIFARVMSAVSRATRTKTLGGPYSIETTKPQGLNAGGSVVPGPNVNKDVVPAMLTPGEFVVNREATARNLPLLQAINNGGSRGPGFNRGSRNPLEGLQRAHLSNDLSAFLMYMDTDVNQRMIRGRTYQGYNGITGLEIANSLESLQARSGVHPAAILRGLAHEMGGDVAGVDNFYNELVRDLRSSDNASRIFGGTNGESFEDFAERRLGKLRSISLPGGRNLHDELRRVRSIRAGGTGRTIGLEMDGRPYGGSNVLNVDPSRRAPRQSSAIGRALLGTRGGFRGAQISRLLSFSRLGLGFNSGGLVPGYQAGGVVRQMAMGTLGYMGGQAIGGQLGGETGSMIGGMLGSMAPMMGGGRGEINYAKSIALQTRFGESLARTSVSSSRLTSTLSRLVIGVTKTNLVIGTATAVAFAGYQMWKKYQEQLEATRSSFSLSSTEASKLGLKYTDYNAKIKATIGVTKALIDRNKALVESVTSASAPFKITVTEYKKLSEEVKNTMQSEIEMINKTSNSKLGNVAAQLKTQFVAAGMSAEEASKKIYMAFQLSNKAQFGYKSTLGNKEFSSVIDQRSAAVSGVNQFKTALGFGDAVAQANALNTALTAIDSGIQQIYTSAEKSAKKKKMDFDTTKEAYNAEKQMLDEIQSKVQNQGTLSTELLEELKKQNPEIRKFANEQDTVVSLFKKMRIAATGFTGDMSTLGATATDALYKIAMAVNNAVQSFSQDKLLKSQYSQLNKLKAQRDDLAKAAKGQSAKEQISAREALKLLDEKIRKIYEEAEARKKALREQQQDEDIKLQIQQKQLEYQDRIAIGDLSGAAQTQLEMERLVREQQQTLTERAIDAAAAKQAAPLESQKAALEKSQQDLADKAAIAADSIGLLDSKIGALQGKIQSFNDAMNAYTLAAQTGEGDLKALWLAVQEAGKQIGVSTGNLYKQFGMEKAGYSAPHDQAMRGIVTPAQVDTNQLLEKLGIKANKVVIEAQQVLDNSRVRPIPSPSPEILQGAARGGASGVLVFDPKTGQWAYTLKSKVTEGMITYDQWQKGKKTYANGGLLRGPGTGTSDSIVAKYAEGGMVRVSNGEYIVNAATVQKLGVPFFDRLNGMKNGGLMLNYSIPKYENGGELIDARAYNPGSSSSNNALYNINVTLNGTNLSPDDVAKAISREMKMREAMSGRNRTIGG